MQSWVSPCFQQWWQAKLFWESRQAWPLPAVPHTSPASTTAVLAMAECTALPAPYINSSLGNRPIHRNKALLPSACKQANTRYMLCLEYSYFACFQGSSSSLSLHFGLQFYHKPHFKNIQLFWTKLSLSLAGKLPRSCLATFTTTTSRPLFKFKPLSINTHSKMYVTCEHCPWIKQ